MLNPYEPGVTDAQPEVPEGGSSFTLVLFRAWTGAKLGVKWSAILAGTVGFLVILECFIYFVTQGLRFGQFAGMAFGSIMMALMIFVVVAPVGIVTGAFLVSLGAHLPSHKVAASANVDPFA